uniref:Alpha-carbonic anhydrase domain-containing protein n=1 Tax=Magallana gigas TaxID=29159 RepID=A0A8W8J0T2_MAGGI
MGKISLDITEDISMNDILPDDWSHYTYHGSLTTPPCFGTVQWIVMRCPIRFSRERGTVDHPKVTVERNFRCGSIENRKLVCPRRGWI